MKILDSRLFYFFKDLEKSLQEFYTKTLKGSFYSFKLKLKIRSLLKARPRKKLTNSEKEKIRLFYRKHKIKNVSTLWHRFYSDCNGIFSEKYVPEDLFYVNVEPSFNCYMFYPALADKNLLGRLFTNVKQPESVVKNVNGFFYHNDELIEFEKAVELCSSPDQMIIKPTIDTWGGKNVRLFSGTESGGDKTEKRVEQLFHSYKKNFIVQKIVQQHPTMGMLNSTSLNTIRVMTYLKEKHVSIVSTVVRMGKSGSFTDNTSTGGISCGVQRNGRLNETGYRYSGEKCTTTDGGLRLKDIELPFMEKIAKTVEKLHKSMPYFRIISWDLAINTAEEVVLIEHNVLGQGINIHQLNNGPVLAELIEENY